MGGAMPKRPKTHAQLMRDRQPPPPDDRPNSAARGYDGKWRKARAAYLSRHPLCVHCLDEGRVAAATVVDHIIPHKGDWKKFWKSDNWQALCASHHSAKTAREDGGFGNRSDNGSNRAD